MPDVTPLAQSSPFLLLHSSFLLTLHVVVRLAARDPFPALEAPVVRVREHDLHEHVVVRAHVQSRDVEAQEREHAPARDTGLKIKRNTFSAQSAGLGNSNVRETTFGVKCEYVKM